MSITEKVKEIVKEKWRPAVATLGATLLLGYLINKYGCEPILEYPERLHLMEEVKMHASTPNTNYEELMKNYKFLKYEKSN